MHMDICLLRQLPLFQGIRDEDLPIMLDCLEVFERNITKVR